MSVVLISVLIIFAISIQDTQQVYMAEEWMWSAHNKFDAKSQSQREVEKALGTANHEKTQLVEKFKATESARQSAEINLATKKATVLDLKTKLQKAQEALVVATEATAYKRGVVETEARLTAKVTVICKDYCAETYYKALDQAGVPTDSDLRRADKV